MQEGFGTQPDDLRVVIGPSISVQVYNVGKDVYDHLRQQVFPYQQFLKLKTNNFISICQKQTNGCF